MNVVGMRSRATAWMLAAGCLVAAAGAAAKPTPLAACNPLEDVETDAAACIGYGTGNHGVGAIEGIAAAENWGALAGAALTEFKDTLLTAGAGSATTLFDAVRDDDPTAGHLTLLDGLDGPFVLLLKGTGAWGAYYYANGAAAGTTIDFDMPELQGNAGLTHASIYATAASVEQRSQTAVPSGVPEPSSLAAVLAGFGALLWTARRRRGG